MNYQNASSIDKNNLIQKGWLYAIDDALVICSLGTAEPTDDYETARKKLYELIQWHIDVALDPYLNGGYKLVPAEPSSDLE